MRVTPATSGQRGVPFPTARVGAADATFPDLRGPGLDQIDRQPVDLDQRDARRALRPTRRDTFGRVREHRDPALRDERQAAPSASGDAPLARNPTAGAAAGAPAATDASPVAPSSGVDTPQPPAPMRSPPPAATVAASPIAPPPVITPPFVPRAPSPPAGTTGSVPQSPARAVELRASTVRDAAAAHPPAPAARQPARATSGVRPAASVRLPSPIELKDHLLQQLKIKVSRDTSIAEIALDPPELGSVTLTMVHDRDGMRAILQADHAAAWLALQAYGREIEAVLRQAGVDLTSLDLRQGEQRSAEQSERPPLSPAQSWRGDEGEASFEPPRMVGLLDVIV